MRIARSMMALALVLATIGGAFAQDEKLPPGTKVVRIEAQPTSMQLTSPFAYSQVLLTGHLDNGDQVDLTRLAKLEKSASFVTVSPRGQVRPKADGKEDLLFSYGGKSATIPVQVSGQKEKVEVSFVQDVMPIISKVGCNAGTCHGAQSGKNGFKLSLRGYDPLYDHRALTDDLEGRRFNRAAPDRSVMLLKPSGEIPHVGGGVITPGDPYYETLRTWIGAGVKLDLESPRVTKIDVFPKSPVVPLIGMKQQMTVQATFSDGKVRDVTAESFIESSNTEITTIDKQGLVTTIRRGEATVMVRYEGTYTATTMVVMGDRSGFVWKDVPEFNYIDTLVYEKLKKVKVLPSDPCSDSAFIRRVYLDLTGLPPEPATIRKFLADNRDTRVKREDLIDQLVGSADFVDHWTNKWADLLQVNRKFLGEKGAAALRAWIRQAVSSNMPYDKFVYDVLTAKGSTLENPPAAYFKVLRDPDAIMENTTQLFLGVRFNCNKCHDHPFERWTQDQYYQMSAFFAQVGRKEDPKFKGQRIGGSAVEGARPAVEVVSDTSSGEVTHLRTGVLTGPKFPYTHKDMPESSASRREQLAKWATSKENVYFATSYVNRLFSYLLGVGLIEPIDDIRAGNPPTNPKLLDRLTKEFVDSGFDVQSLIKIICKSRVYQHSLATNKWNEDDEINYSHALARRLPAEVLYDAIHRTTGSMSKLPGLPPGARAAQMLDSQVDVGGGFFDLFGRPARESACECERSAGILFGPVLNLVNGPVIAEAIKDPSNRITKLLATEKDDRKVVEEIFLAILNRPPSAKQLAAGLKALQDNQEEFDRLKEQHARLAAELAAYEKQLPAKQAEWEKQLRESSSIWTVLEPSSATAKGGTTLTAQKDGSILASGSNPTPEVYTIVGTSKLKGITAIRLEVLTDKSLPANGPGRAPNGNFVLNDVKVTAAPAEDPSKSIAITLRRAIATYSQEGFGVALAIDRDAATGWAIAPQLGKSHIAIFEIKDRINFEKETTLTIVLDQQFEGKQHNLGKFRLAVTTAKPPLTLGNEVPENIVKIVAIAADKRTDEQKAAVAAYYRAQDMELARLTKAVAASPAPGDARLIGAQDLAWALINSPAFLFNH